MSRQDHFRRITLTWSIPPHPGGMTAAALARTAAVAGPPAGSGELIIFRPEASRRRDRRVVAAEYPGDAPPAVSNVWDILAELPLSDANPDQGPATDEPLSEANSVPTDVDGRLRIRTRYGADGTAILQRDHYRPDGTLLVMDRRDTKVPGEPGGRRVTLLTPDGRVARTWSSIWKLYAYVLDQHLHGDRTVLYVDSKIVARFVAAYRRPNVATVHVVHSSHLRRGCKPPIAPLKRTRADIFRELFRFDAVVCSTVEQKADVEALLGPAPNLHVISPAVDAPEHVRMDRPSGHGVILASLTDAKRLQDAVKAVVRARTLARDADLTLDVYGSGPECAELHSIIHDLDADGYVRLHDFDPDARRHFASAGWTLLTSRYEGFGIALAEALGAGCLPVAYDIPYGPATLLRPLPENLVPDGDIEAAARRIAAISTTPPARLAPLREAARQHVQQFTPARAGERWAELETQLLSSLPHPPAVELRFTVESAEVGHGRKKRRIEVRLDTSAPLLGATLGFTSATPPFEHRVAARLTRSHDGVWRLRAKLTLVPEPDPTLIVGTLSTATDTVRFLTGIRPIPRRPPWAPRRLARRLITALRRRVPRGAAAGETARGRTNDFPAVR
jgi:poly(glycerol-phosphate) alpha-glucosyltransferase